MALTENNLGRETEDWDKGSKTNTWNYTELPFYKRMLRGMLKSYMEAPDYVDDTERKLKFQNKMLARVGRSKSKFFRLA